MTSNIAESTNNVLKADRELAVIELLDAIWHRVANLRVEQEKAAEAEIEKGVVSTAYTMTAIKEGCKWAQSNTVCLLLLQLYLLTPMA